MRLQLQKAAGLDKKLYKQLDKHLENRYNEDLALMQTLSPSPPNNHSHPAIDITTTTASTQVPPGKVVKTRRSSSSAHGSKSNIARHNSKSPPGPSNLIASSPFGPLDVSSSRKAFTYLVATLNASHPDHDFSTFLNPSDFHREESPMNLFQTLSKYILPSSPVVMPAGLRHG